MILETGRVSVFQDTAGNCSYKNLELKGTLESI